MAALSTGPRWLTSDARRHRRFVGVMIVGLVACGVTTAGCGGEPETTRATGSGGAMTVIPPALSSVSADGAAWLLQARSEGPTLALTVAREGRVAESQVDIGDMPEVDAAIVPAADGVVVVAYACAEDPCREVRVIVRGFALADGEVRDSGMRWESEPVTTELADAPRWAGASDDAVAVMAANQVLRIDADAVDPVPLPDGVGDPCLTPGGELLAIASPPAEPPSPDRVVEIPDPSAPVELTFTVRRADGAEWTEVASSELTLAPDAIEMFRCGTRGLEHAVEDQPATQVWVDGWDDGSAAPIEWELTTRSPVAGLVGVRDGAAVMLDSVTGEPILSVPLGPELADAVRPTDALPEPAATVAIGGPVTSPTALVCSTIVDEAGRVSCAVA